MWMYIFDQAMKPTGRIKTSGIVIITMCLIDITIVDIFISKIGLYAFMLKFLISPVIIFLFYFFYWKNKIHFKLETKNVLLMSYLILSFFLLLGNEKYLTSNYKINFLFGLSLSVLSFFILNKSERDFILKKTKDIITSKLFSKKVKTFA